MMTEVRKVKEQFSSFCFCVSFCNIACMEKVSRFAAALVQYWKRVSRTVERIRWKSITKIRMRKKPKPKPFQICWVDWCEVWTNLMHTFSKINIHVEHWNGSYAFQTMLKTELKVTETEMCKRRDMICSGFVSLTI